MGASLAKHQGIKSSELPWREAVIAHITFRSGLQTRDSQIVVDADRDLVRFLGMWHTHHAALLRTLLLRSAICEEVPGSCQRYYREAARSLHQHRQTPINRCVRQIRGCRSRRSRREPGHSLRSNRSSHATQRRQFVLHSPKTDRPILDRKARRIAYDHRTSPCPGGSLIKSYKEFKKVNSSALSCGLSSRKRRTTCEASPPCR